MRISAKVLLLALALALGANGSRAAVLVNQPWDSSSGNKIAQYFPSDGWGAYEFDDFTTGTDYFVTSLYAQGIELGDPSYNLDVVGEIWDGLPGSGSLVLSSVTGTQMGSDLSIDFGGQYLPAGSYWITAYVVREFTPGYQWFWYGTTPINGSEEYFYDPSNIFSYGVLVPGSVVFSASTDMAFVLQGNPVPEPSTVGLIGLGIVAVALRRRSRK
ncbi:MAG TPA: PEP-CTERM sorting domain-containing protein [Candidatus Brocadiia bacterium]|nr:PEP-CTERM sorting domain-containing protein [Candidatus Brocadiia bacterium]